MHFNSEDPNKKIEKKNVIIEYRNKININIMFFPLTSKGRKCRNK